MSAFYLLSSKAIVLSWMLILIAFGGFAQQFASAGNSPLFLYQTRDNPKKNRTIRLKEALGELKKRFGFKFAFQHGLLAGKVISDSLLNSKLMPENIVGRILQECQLGYKQINEKQFIIYSLSDPSKGGTSPINEGLYSNNVSLHTSGSDTVGRDLTFVVKGKVTSQEDGLPMPGVNILLKGSSHGTSTNADGNFSFNMPNEGGVLVFSFIGFISREASVSGNQTALDIALKPDAAVLSEVVVTALGIERSKSTIAYSVTEVKGEEFTQSRENNVANALIGKVAGVDAAGISTGPGGSSRVVIRGNGSVTGNSQPLYVINGMPMDNSVPGGSSLPNGLGLTQSVDRGDGIAAINPDDIESITVLKGGTAAALYGSRGANGVILITTKKGKAQKGVGIEYNSIFSLEKISVFPDYQYEYGQGDGGVKPTTLSDAQTTGRRSFGSKIDGSTDYVAADGLNHPYVAQKDNLKKFYQTGNTFTNTLAFSGGNETIVYRLSLSHLTAQSILPNSTYDRKTANLNISAKLSDKLRVESVMQFNLETGNNRPAAGDALGNPNWTPYEAANTVDVRWLSPGHDAKGDEMIWNDVAIATNGYFVVNKFKENDAKNRFIGQASVSYDLLKNLTIKGTVTRDFYNYNFTSVMPTGTQYVLNGRYAGIKSDAAETNGMFTVAYKTRFNDKFGISLLAGANSRKFENKEINLNGQDFIQPYFYSFTNLSAYSIVPNTTRTMTNSVFGSADFDYKNIIFFTVTGRQDWFSTLSPSNNHIFYPSLGSSFVLSDAFSLPQVINVARIRASWAQVGGGGPDPYAIHQSYSGVPSASVPLQNVTSTAVTNAKLRPFTSATAEIGLNVQLMDNRLGLDLAAYNRKTTDDIVNVPISSTSGYSSAILNSGQLSNQGIEVLLTGTPIKTTHFSWNVSYNFAYNRSLVLKLADGISTFSLGRSTNGNAYINNNVGNTYGAIYGYRKLRDANGNIVFDVNSGLPLQTDINQELGKGVPPFITGLTNEFRYKNFSLSFMLDGKFGHSIFSVTEVYGTRLGLLKSTLAGRENGLFLTGVTPAGDRYSHTIPVSNLRAGYYNSLNRYTELFIHDASFVKLRQVIFTFRLPVEKLQFLKLQSASISLTGRNLLILYKNTDNFDPEQSLTNGPAQGIESFGLPRTRSYGINLMLKF